MAQAARLLFPAARRKPLANSARRYLAGRAAIVRTPTKFGETPNLTRETRVLPTYRIPIFKEHPSTDPLHDLFLPQITLGGTAPGAVFEQNSQPAAGGIKCIAAHIRLEQSSDNFEQ